MFLANYHLVSEEFYARKAGVRSQESECELCPMNVWTLRHLGTLGPTPGGLSY